MKTMNELLTSLRHQGIRLYIDENRLRYQSTQSAINPSLLKELKIHKNEIIKFLQKNEKRCQVKIKKHGISSVGIPLSFAQQRLWFLNQMGHTTAYNMSLNLNLKGNLNDVALQQALQEIVRRHESLRTTFELDNGVPRQVIHIDMHIDLPVTDLSTYASKTQEIEVQRLIKAEINSPFNLGCDPMLRANLLRLNHSTSNTADISHVLLLTMHHIASDGWSLGILVQELSVLYTAFSQGQSSFLPELPIQYADFAVWQRDHLQGEELARQLSYWKKHLAGAPPLLQLPTDYPRSAQQSFQGEGVLIEIDTEQVNGLRHLSQQQGVTLYMTLLAAFQVLMFRHTNQSDIVIASPIANRNRQEIESLIGFFVNTLAMRANLTDSNDEPLPFNSLLAQIKKTTEAAYNHQDLPFERLVEELQPERDLNYNPLVQVVFSLQNAPMEEFNLAELVVTPTQSEVQTTRFDLEMHIWEQGNRLQGSCIYNTELFDKQTIERMMGHFQNLLTGIIANPHASITDLPLLTEKERHQILVEWNNTTTNYPKNKCIHQLFEAQVERTPNALAVLFESDYRYSKESSDLHIKGQYSQQSLTYRELNERANQLAYYLMRLGVSRETLIGICIPRSLDMVVGLLAILKAGGAYVPLDSTYPQERLAFMLKNANLNILLTHEKMRSNLPKVTTTLCLDSLNLEGTQTINLQREHLTTKDLAYVMYTSGSTGRPKGVSVSHQNVVRLVKETNFISFSQKDVFLQLAPISFDAATFELWAPLLNGSRLVLMPPSNPSLHELGSVILKHQVTTLWLTAGLFQLMVDERLKDLQTLQWLLAGGDVLSVSHVRQAIKALPHCQLINGYGPTENTTFTCCFSIQNMPSKAIPIGHPIANSSVYILDNQLQPVPVGVFGELYAGGDGVARGYHNDEALTQKYFINNPFGSGQLYRTGDQVRWLPNGEIEFMGRLDTQVKIRGFRIELGETEATLVQHPQVNEAVVITDQKSSTEKRLVAYLVTNNSDTQAQNDYISQWQNLYEETYNQSVQQENLAFNLTGWKSSYTGEAIPEKEMEEWVSTTVDEIRSLKPTRVWEIGCGTGLLLSRLAPDCVAYWGSDYSEQAIQHVTQLIKNPNLNHVVLSQRMADDLRGVEEDQFDCVILNSIVQYFPSVDYLLTVLEGAVRAVKPGGNIYVGDVRNLCLLSTYHTAVQLFQADDKLPLTQLQARIQQRLQDEEELLIDPDFFYALRQHLPEIDQVEIKLKRGNYHNELTQFRYQVVLHIASAKEKKNNVIDYRWDEEDWSQQNWTIDTLLEYLRFTQKSKNGLLIRNIPNARVQEAVQSMNVLNSATTERETVAQLRTSLSRQDDHGVEPETLWALEKAFPYKVLVTWSNLPNMMNAYFIHSSQTKKTAFDTLIPQYFVEKKHVLKAWSNYTNNPLQGKLSLTLISKIRTWLQQKLPDYMIPSAFVLLDTLPLTPNGKIDRKALPAIENSQSNLNVSTVFVAPRDETERQLTQIWQEVLGLHAVGVQDNFFDLGGHSFLAVRLMAQIEQRFNINLPLATLFNDPTIEQLAAKLTKSSKKPKLDWSTLVPIQPKGEKLPFFAVPGGGGNVLCFYDLARLMGSQQPFYGLQSVGLDGKTTPHSTVEAISAHYVQEILSVQSQGPYLLGGHSFGAKVVFEMAQQLLRMGHKIARLIIFDAPAPHVYIKSEMLNWDDTKWFSQLIEGISEWANQETKLSYQALKLLEPSEQLFHVNEELIRLNFLPKNASLRQTSGWLQVFKTNTLMTYTPSSTIPIPITLFRAEELFDAPEINVQETQKYRHILKGLGSTWGWNELAKESVDIISVPGDHSSMIESPHVEILAERLREYLLKNIG